jgi:predicted RNA binding protein YcfA (HicA-like mRNA interferase family)
VGVAPTSWIVAGPLRIRGLGRRDGERRGRIGGHAALEDHADHDLAVTIDLVEDTRPHPLRGEETTDRGLQLGDEQVHAGKAVTGLLFSVNGEPCRIGTPVALLTGMLALPHVSGTECILALRRLGFRAQRRSGGLVTLGRGQSHVIVPETATLGPALVNAILRAAEVEPFEFLDAFEAAEQEARTARTNVA